MNDIIFLWNSTSMEEDDIKESLPFICYDSIWCIIEDQPVLDKLIFKHLHLSTLSSEGSTAV